MDFINYCKFDKKELFDLLSVSLIFGLLFGIFFLRVSSNYSLFYLSFLFFLFIFILFFLRVLFMKLIGFYYGIKVKVFERSINNFGFTKYQRLSHYKLKPIKFSFVSIFLFLISFGFIIFPSVFKFEFDKIPYRLIGSRLKKEIIPGKLILIGISNLRIARIQFFSFVYYFFFALFLKYLAFLFDEKIFIFFMFIIFWIAFISIMPIFPFEGFEFLRRDVFSWISSFVILFIGLFLIFLLTNFILILFSTLLISFIILMVLFWRFLMK